MHISITSEENMPKKKVLLPKKVVAAIKSKTYNSLESGKIETEKAKDAMGKVIMRSFGFNKE